MSYKEAMKSPPDRNNRYRYFDVVASLDLHNTLVVQRADPSVAIRPVVGNLEGEDIQQAHNRGECLVQVPFSASSLPPEVGAVPTMADKALADEIMFTDHDCFHATTTALSGPHIRQFFQEFSSTLHAIAAKYIQSDPKRQEIIDQFLGVCADCEIPFQKGRVQYLGKTFLPAHFKDLTPTDSKELIALLYEHWPVENSKAANHWKALFQKEKELSPFLKDLIYHIVYRENLTSLANTGIGS